MTTPQVKSNFKYQKQIERSFAVIYHNLKRIRDDTSLKGARGNQTKTLNPVSPQPYPLRDNSQSTKKAASNVMTKRVSFPIDIDHI